MKMIRHGARLHMDTYYKIVRYISNTVLATCDILLDMFSHWRSSWIEINSCNKFRVSIIHIYDHIVIYVTDMLQKHPYLQIWKTIKIGDYVYVYFVLFYD